MNLSKLLTNGLLGVLFASIFISCDCSIDPADVIATNFSTDTRQVCVGESVAFTDLTTNNPTAWEWRFEGGFPETSSLQNPIVAYEEPGTYRVTLKAFKGDISSYESKDTFITVIDCTPLLLVDFTSDTTTIHACDTVFYADASESGITSWLWTFEGGTPATSTQQNPQITYSTPGTYTVTLQASKNGKSNIKTIQKYLTVVAAIPPVISFTANKTSLVASCDTVSFTAATDTPVDGWSWKFEGGTPATSTEQNPKVVYKDGGTFNVTLAVTKCNAQTELVKTDYIVATAPSISFTSDRTTVGSLCDVVSFTATSDIPLDGWNWTFEGGTPATSTEQNPKVTYNNVGTYDVSLTAVVCGKSVQATKNDYITATSLLIAHYKFDGNANDASGNGHHGTVSGPILVAGRDGSSNTAYKFDGIDDFIEVPDHADLRLNGFDYSISAWVKIDGPNNAWDNTVLSKRSNCNQNGWFLHVTDNAHETLPANVFVYNISGCSDPQLISPSTIITYGKWHNLIIVYQASTRKLIMYIDGVEVLSETNMPAPNAQESSNLFIGMDKFTSAFRDDFYFKGTMDDIRIYRKALQLCEIKNLQE